jgi:hypothetical protein
MVERADSIVGILTISCAITFALFLGASVIVLIFARRRFRVTAALHPTSLGSAWGGMAPLWYAGTIAVGLVGIVAGFILMKDPKTARQGYVCVALGVAHMLVLVIATCAALLVLAAYFEPKLG